MQRPQQPFATKWAADGQSRHNCSCYIAEHGEESSCDSNDGQRGWSHYKGRAEHRHTRWRSRRACGFWMLGDLLRLVNVSVYRVAFLWSAFDICGAAVTETHRIERLRQMVVEGNALGKPIFVVIASRSIPRWMTGDLASVHRMQGRRSELQVRVSY